jgi:hypothetical protein
MADLQQRNTYELQSLTQVERKLWSQQIWNNREQQFQEKVLDHCTAEPVSDKLYHGRRGESALYVDNLRETLTTSTSRELFADCKREGYQRLELLTAGNRQSQLEIWHREAERQDIRLTVKQIPGQLVTGEKVNRRQLTFEEIPRLIWRRLTRKGKRYLELIELQFNDPSPGQRELLERSGWQGLVCSWWVRNRDGNVVWQSGTMETESGNVPLLSGQLPAAEKLQLEVRNQQGLVW